MKERKSKIKIAKQKGHQPKHIEAYSAKVARKTCVGRTALTPTRHGKTEPPETIKPKGTRKGK